MKTIFKARDGAYLLFPFLTVSNIILTVLLQHWAVTPVDPAVLTLIIIALDPINKCQKFSPHELHFTFPTPLCTLLPSCSIFSEIFSAIPQFYYPDHTSMTMVKLPTSIFSPASSLAKSTKNPQSKTNQVPFLSYRLNAVNRKSHQWNSWSKTGHRTPPEEGINTFPSFPFLTAGTAQMFFPFPFLGLRVDLWLSHTYEVNPSSVLLSQRQSALSHSHGHTALPLHQLQHSFSHIFWKSF